MQRSSSSEIHHRSLTGRGCYSFTVLDLSGALPERLIARFVSLAERWWRRLFGPLTI